MGNKPGNFVDRQFEKGNELTPLHSIELDKISTFKDMLEAMELTAFSGRQLGRAYDILSEMFRDPNTFVVLTLSGALTVAKQGRIICDLIERNCVDAVVSTGALLTHGLIEGMGVQHYFSEGMDDAEAYRKGYNRVYDTIELEVSFKSLEQLISTHLEELIPALDGRNSPMGSADFCRRLGELSLRKFPEEKNILTAAARAGVPVYIPGFTDCELSIGIMISYLKEKRGIVQNPMDGAEPVPFNPFEDLIDYTRRVMRHSGKLAIFTLGGGVPRNWAQQVAPFVDILNQEGFPVDRRIFSRGVRICPEPVHWGGLSGCTYREGVSWGKFVPEDEGGRYAEVPAEVTSVLPLLIKAVFENIETGSRSN